MQKKPQQKSKLNRIKQRALKYIEGNGSLTLFIVGLALVLLGTNHEVLAQSGSSTPYDGLVKSFKPLDYGVCAIFRFAEGSYGALLTTVAGIVAIASAAFGKYNQAYNMLIVAVGCFILRAFISLFFANYTCMNNDPTRLWHLPEADSESAGNASGGNGGSSTTDNEEEETQSGGDEGSSSHGEGEGDSDEETGIHGEDEGDTEGDGESNGHGEGEGEGEGDGEGEGEDQSDAE